MLRSSDTRGQSDSEKWHKYAGTNILPMWVADTEFLAAPAILEALQERLEHGVFGIEPDQRRRVTPLGVFMPLVMDAFHVVHDRSPLESGIDRLPMMPGYCPGSAPAGTPRGP